MRFWFYSIRSLWRTLRGRWYVWRDVPTDIVRQAASVWFVARKEKDYPDTALTCLRDAYNEAKLRKRKGLTK